MVHHSRMKLREWLKRNSLSVRQFAADIGETDTIARKWVYGQRQPSLPKAIAIEEFTRGEVSARDLLVGDIPASTAVA